MYSQVPSSSNVLAARGVRQRDYSNNVLVTNNGGIYFCPAYLRVIFLEVEDIDIQQLTANFYTILLITIYYKNLPQVLFDQLKEIRFSARNIETVILRGDGENRNSTIRNNTDQYCMEYTYRGKLPLRLQCDVLMAPFQVIDFKLMLLFHPISVIKDNKLLKVKFNFMDIDDIQTKCNILYKDSNISGSYGLAQSSLTVEFEAQRQQGMRKRNRMLQLLPPDLIKRHNATDLCTFKVEGGLIHQGRIHSWKFANYKFKMYRYPVNVLIIIFVPLWILSFTNLVIFWAAPTDVSGRLQTISGLMIAYSALLPTIREKIPPSPNITLLEWMVYALSFTIFLSSLETLIAVTDVGYVFTWNQNWRFILSMTLTILTMVISVALCIIYKCIWQPRYNFMKDTNMGLQFQDYKIDNQVWYNHEASAYFKNKTTIVGQTPQKDIKQIANQNFVRPNGDRSLPVGTISNLMHQQQNNLIVYPQSENRIQQQNIANQNIYNNRQNINHQYLRR